MQTKPTVLIVEDNPANQDLLCQQLEFLGYPVEISDNGHEAYAMLKQKPIAIILTDINMPEMDGYQLSHKIRRLAQELPQSLKASPPKQQAHIIIAITAKALPGEREKCLAAGMNDYLAKPIDIFELQNVLDKWVVQE